MLEKFIMLDPNLSYLKYNEICNQITVDLKEIC